MAGKTGPLRPVYGAVAKGEIPIVAACGTTSPGAAVESAFVMIGNPGTACGT